MKVPSGRGVCCASSLPHHVSSHQGALSELDLKSFQGRLLRLCAAKQKPDKPEKAEPKARLDQDQVER